MVNNINFENCSTISFVNKKIKNSECKIAKENHDFDSLTKFLKENGVSDEDIDTLENLIEQEGEINLKTGYGKKVKEWITHLIRQSTE